MEVICQILSASAWNSKTPFRYNPLMSNLVRVRVTAVFRDLCLLQFPTGEKTAEVTGRFRFEAESKSDYPAVGDWVMASLEGPDLALIHALAPRTSSLSRKAPGQKTEEQVLAANIEVAFIITSFNEDFNLRRLERYLAIVKHAGAEPVIVINKSDAAEERDDRHEKAAAVAGGAPVYRVSAVSGEGLDHIRAHLPAGATGIFLGSSGVGKSTLLNRLLGQDVQDTQTIRLSDAKGRHTTTVRQMFVLPNGGWVIDTPGLREIQLWMDASVLPDVYDDIAALAAQCRFRDCRHETEKDCAVRPALEAGSLPDGRWQGYLKLQKELAYLKRKQDPEENANTKKRWKRIHKSLRNIDKRK